MLDRLKENKIVNNSQFYNTSVIHVIIYTVDLPQVFCVFMFFCRWAWTFGFHTRQKLNWAWCSKDQTKVSVRINEVIYSRLFTCCLQNWRGTVTFCTCCCYVNCRFLRCYLCAISCLCWQRYDHSFKIKGCNIIQHPLYRVFFL